MTALFLELGIIMTIVLLVSMIMSYLKQPLLIGYILTGVVAGPLFFNLVTDQASYEAFSHIGIALLLFIVGLNLNVKLIQEVGLISLITGIGQVLFTSVFGFLIALALGFSVVSSMIIAICLTFSSTIIIVKLLSDKKDIDTLYGKIAMGFLLVQDLVAVIILMFLGTFLSLQGTSIEIAFLKTVVFGLAIIFFTTLLAKHLLPYLIDKVAKSQELFFLFIIAWCFGLSSVFSYVGFSIEIGALVAGIALASSSYQYDINAKVRPLRDFFIIMFFIVLGSQMVPLEVIAQGDTIMDKLSLFGGQLADLAVPAILFSLFVLIGNPLIVLILMSIFGYSSRTGFLAGLTVAQISEFSLILAIMAKDVGFLSIEDVSMITAVGVITIISSTYMILNGDKLYNFFKPILKKLDRPNLKDSRQGIQGKKHEILIFGYDRIGYSLVKSLENRHKTYLIVDHDPDVIRKLEKKKLSTLYGDAGNVEFLSEFDFKDVSLVISTIPEDEVNSLILESVRQVNKTAIVILTSNHIDSALELYNNGADYVILPHFLGGSYAATLLDQFEDNVNGFLDEKIKHINELKERKEFGMEHPKYEK